MSRKELHGSWELPLVAGAAMAMILAFALWPNKNPEAPSALFPARDEAERIAAECRAAGWYECYQEKLEALAYRSGLKASEGTLLAFQELDPNARNCHVLAHRIGRGIASKEPERWKSFLNEADINACGGGYLHGIMEAYLELHPDEAVDVPLANQVCTSVEGPYRKRMCYHFFGHFFLVETSGDLPLALPFCRAMPEGYRFDCLDGLFMEDHQKIALADHRLADLPDFSPAYVVERAENCRKFSEVEGQACWTEMAELYAKQSGYDPKVIHEGCSGAPRLYERDACYLKGVIVMATYLGFDTPEKLLGLCVPYPAADPRYRTCTDFVLSGLMHYSPRYVDRGIVLCGGIAEPYRDWCFETLGRHLTSAVPARPERAPFCQSFPPNYRSGCR